MDDITTYVLLGTSFFFVALSFALLARYRQVSQRINTSTDMGRDLWASLEQRLRKQDERILDMMARFDVIQARAMAATVSQPSSPVASPQLVAPVTPLQEKQVSVTEQTSVEQRPESQESHVSQSATGAAERKAGLDETQLSALKLVSEGPKNTRQLTDALQRSREHTARIMKELFEMGLVGRNNSSKPFVYELSDEGRRRLSA
jgi:hypothetical protein